MIAKGPYIGFSNKVAADRPKCSLTAGGAYKAGGIISVGTKGLSDIEVTVFAGVGAQTGASCTGLSVQIPAMPS